MVRRKDKVEDSADNLYGVLNWNRHAWNESDYVVGVKQAVVRNIEKQMSNLYYAILEGNLTSIREGRGNSRSRLWLRRLM